MATGEQKKPSKPKKPYEEISAIFNGNEVKIRVPKSTFKPAKLTPSQLKLQQNCTCEDDMSVCSETCGMGADGGNNNRINFQYVDSYRSEQGHRLLVIDNTRTKHVQDLIPDDICEALTNRTQLNSEMVMAMEEKHNNLCNVCNVTPKDAPKGVQAQKVLHPDKDVFVLKIGKQTDEPNRTGNIEVELVTPRAPAKFKPATHNCVQIQCEENELRGCMPCGACQSRATPGKRRKCRRARCCH